MGGIKTKGRGPDKKKRKSRKRTTAVKTPEKTSTKTSKKPNDNILSGIIDAISSRIKKEKVEPWSLDVGPRVTSQMLGRHVFKSSDVVEINLNKL